MILDNPYVAIALAVAGFTVGWGTNGWRADAKLSRVKTEYAQSSMYATQRALLDQKNLFERKEHLTQELAQADKLELEKLKGAENETQRLRACLRNGTCGLRVAAICPTTSSQLPSPTSSSSVDTTTPTRLTEAAGQDYLDLRAQIDRTQSTLSACQASIKTLTGQ